MLDRSGRVIMTVALEPGNTTKQSSWLYEPIVERHCRHLGIGLVITQPIE